MNKICICFISHPHRVFDTLILLVSQSQNEELKENSDVTTLTPNAGLTVPCSLSPSSIFSSAGRRILVK